MGHKEREKKKKLHLYTCFCIFFNDKFLQNVKAVGKKKFNGDKIYQGVLTLKFCLY